MCNKCFIHIPELQTSGDQDPYLTPVYILRFYSFALSTVLNPLPLLWGGPLTLEAGLLYPLFCTQLRGHPKSRSRKHGHQNLV